MVTTRLLTAIAIAWSVPQDPEPKAPATPVVTIRDRDLSEKLNVLENWKTEKGVWSQERGAARGAVGGVRNFEATGIRGAGDSAAHFQAKIPADARLEFTLNVVEGMRPRMLLHGMRCFIGNEGFEKHLFVYGDGARDLKGRKIPYENGKPVTIRLEMWGEDFSVWVNSELCAVAKRIPPADGVGSHFAAANDWSKGACTWSKLAVFVRP
jgi:hypothetical protein